MKTTRRAAGYYLVVDGDHTVEVMQQDFWDGPAWIAVALWTNNLFSDPVPTKREAVRIAQNMIEKRNS